MTSADLLWNILFGAIGSGFCLYAKRQHALVTGVCGVGLLVVPYLVSNTYTMVAVCVALTAGPFVIDEPS